MIRTIVIVRLGLDWGVPPFWGNYHIRIWNSFVGVGSLEEICRVWDVETPSV